MILLALGANLPSPEFGPPQATLQVALSLLPAYGAEVAACSSWYESPAVPPSAQPDYVNAVARLTTRLTPEALLERLHLLEARLGRQRRQRWEPRVADLDLLAFHRRVREANATSPLVLPHARMSDRAFVLAPLAELAPRWRHPVSGLTARALLRALPAAALAQVVRLAAA